MKKPFEFLPHTADVKFLAYGKTLEEAFANAALAMFQVMSKDKVRGTIKRRIFVKGSDYENLLYKFLEEFLFLLDSKNYFLRGVKVKIRKKVTGLELEAHAIGDDVKKYSTHTLVKAVTYNEMYIKQDSHGWKIQVVLDV